MMRFLFVVRNLNTQHLAIMDKKTIALCAMLCAHWAFGAGFQVLEQGAANLGTALGGATANAAGDASAAFWNPSASAFQDMRPGETKIDSAITFVIPSFEFRNTDSSPNLGTNEGGNAGEVAYVPNFYMIHKFTEELYVTMSGTSTYGLETDYANGWIGRYHALNSDLMTLDFNPSIVYKPVDWLSFSAGGSLQWMHAQLTQAAPIYVGGTYITDALVNLSGSSLSGGANVGMTIEYAENGRIGFGWRSEVAHSLSGNQKVNGSITNPIDCDITLPQTFNVGFYQRLWGPLHRFAVMADYAWTGWSSFSVLDIKNGDTGASVGNPVNENWKNTSRVALGFNYNPAFSKNFVFRWGAAWDESPIRSAEFRSARIPCTDRLWLSCGLGYRTADINIDVGYTYIYFLEDPEIHTAGGPTNSLNGYYVGHAHVVSIQAGIYF